MDYNLDIKKEPLENLDINAEFNSFSNDIENEEGIVKDEYKMLSTEEEFDEIEEVECTICQRIFECEKFLKAHIKTHIAQEGIDNTNLKETFLECEKCLKNFDTEKELKSHILLHVDTVPDKELNVDKEDLIQKEIQLSRENNGKLYKCEECPKSFSHKRSLINHKQLHTDTELPTCEICFKKFTKASNLVTHMRIHTGERPFKCDVCSKSFKQQNSLKTHLRIHTGERPFICDVCGKSFSNEKSLTNHLPSHTCERPFKCEVCTRSFCQRIHLTVHMRVHTGERPFTCEVCTKGFKTRCELRRHLSVHGSKLQSLQEFQEDDGSCKSNSVVDISEHLVDGLQKSE